MAWAFICKGPGSELAITEHFRLARLLWAGEQLTMAAQPMALVRPSTFMAYKLPGSESVVSSIETLHPTTVGFSLGLDSITHSYRVHGMFSPLGIRATRSVTLARSIRNVASSSILVPRGFMSCGVDPVLSNHMAFAETLNFHGA